MNVQNKKYQVIRRVTELHPTLSGISPLLSLVNLQLNSDEQPRGGVDINVIKMNVLNSNPVVESGTRCTKSGNVVTKYFYMFCNVLVLIEYHDVEIS